MMQCETCDLWVGGAYRFKRIDFYAIKRNNNMRFVVTFYRDLKAHDGCISCELAEMGNRNQRL
jgi:hypothetical protein